MVTMNVFFWCVFALFCLVGFFFLSYVTLLWAILYSFFLLAILVFIYLPGIHFLFFWRGGGL